MGDLARRDWAALQTVLQGPIGVARVLGMQPVGPALADRVKLDPLDQASGAERFISCGVEEVDASVYFCNILGYSGRRRLKDRVNLPAIEYWRATLQRLF